MVLDVAGAARVQGLLRTKGRELHSRATGVRAETDVAGDLTRAPFADEAFDVIVCYHVLEHIRDDRAALRELARVLRKDGRALIQVPWDKHPEASVEFDAADRLQHDHVRIYGEDLLDRISESGLQPT